MSADLLFMMSIIDRARGIVTDIEIQSKNEALQEFSDDLYELIAVLNEEMHAIFEERKNANEI
jgi:mannitol/fructose-specific phosphotransferase system IIA component (Ntr-type)